MYVRPCLLPVAGCRLRHLRYALTSIEIVPVAANSDGSLKNPFEPCTQMWYMEMPVVSRVYLTAAVLTTAACALELVSPFHLYFNLGLIKQGQVGLGLFRSELTQQTHGCFACASID